MVSATGFGAYTTRFRQVAKLLQLERREMLGIFDAGRIHRQVSMSLASGSVWVKTTVVSMRVTLGLRKRVLINRLISNGCRRRNNDDSVGGRCVVVEG